MGGDTLKVGDIFTLPEEDYPYNTYKFRVVAVYPNKYNVEVVEPEKEEEEDVWL